MFTITLLKLRIEDVNHHSFINFKWKGNKMFFFWFCFLFLEKVYFRSPILERPSIGKYWNISGVPVLTENVIFTFFRTCWCYSEAYNTRTQK